MFSSLVDSARMEFHSCLQLLAERARFLSAADGVAIALEQGDEFVYCATSGDSVPGPGAVVETGNEAIRQCMETRQAVLSTCGAKFALTAPVLRGERVVGLFRLEAGLGFEERDIEAVARLAELATTVLDQWEASERAESLVRDSSPGPDASTLPVAWHASEAGEAGPNGEAAKKPVPRVLDLIHACVSCGFPVSPGRRLCVECEQKPGVRTNPPAEFLASAQKQESWIAVHGYTIASLLVTALTAAIILWLRR